MHLGETTARIALFVLAVTLQPGSAVLGQTITPSTANAAAEAVAVEEAEEVIDEAPLLLQLFKSEANITNAIGMIMIHVPKGYRVAEFETTQSQYQRIMAATPSKYPGAKRPVERVSWTEAQQFCRTLTERERADGVLPEEFEYSLPTEKQWEFFVADAALSQAIVSYIGDRPWTENVGLLAPNELGLYDVRGNVWEWCLPQPIARGGSYQSHEDALSISARYAGTPDLKFMDIGFRVVLKEVGTQ